MLRMQCAHCGNLIESQLLTEMTSVYCRRCGSFQDVGELYVTSRGFTVLRRDLLDRLKRWERLLRDALKDREMLEFAERFDPREAERLDRLIASLRELLDGARDHFRLYLDPPVEVSCCRRGGEALGKLVNLSIFGACIQLRPEVKLLHRGDRVELEVQLPASETLLRLDGRVAWSAKRPGRMPVHEIGVAFDGLEDAARNALWKYIIVHKDVTKPYLPA
ncbi:MAG: hypothetical protein Tsb0017_10720 [Geothermobacteraceae bacterium]